MNPVRIGVVGLGRFGRLHARTLAGLAEAKLVALVDADPAACAALAAELPGIACWSALEPALHESGAEAWVIATQTASHIALAESALRAGAAVLIEKPLAPTLAEARRLAPLVASQSRNVMLGHVVLFAPEFRQIAREVRQRGRLHYIQAERHRPEVTIAQFGGESPLRLLMIHDLALVLALAGDAEPVRVAAALHQRHGDGAIDLAVARLEWADGLWAGLTASFLTPPGMPADGFDRFDVYGRGWAGRMQLNPQPVSIWAERHEWPLTLAIDSDPAAPSGWLAEELRMFCRVARGATPPVGTRYEDGVRLLGWLEHLEAAAQRGG